MMERETQLRRAQQILQHPLYRQEYERLQQLEQGRIFCCHTLEHFLDVARVCWIWVLEQGLDLNKDTVYAAGLLHDIGKGLQYAQGTPHHEAGAALAARILPDCGYTGAEIGEITEAILCHRHKTESDAPLARLLYAADKQTRLCFCCPAEAECNWPAEKKTRAIV